MGAEYSNLKMAWHLVHDGKVASAPKQAQVILSDLCNQNCGFCAYRMDGYSSNEMFVGASEKARYGHNNPKRFIPTERALALMDELAAAGVQAVQFTGGGEPTVHPEHERIFKYALERGLKCALVSNGLRWSDPLIAVLRQFAWVRVSIDAGTEETYARTRETAPGNFRKVWGNVQRLAHVIRTPEAGRPTCLLGIGYVVTPENCGEIALGVKYAAESGARYIRMSAMFSPDGTAPYRGIYEKIKRDIAAARARYEHGLFAVHDLFGDRLQDLEEGPPDYDTCYYQRYNTYIGGDLNVYRCCVLAYNKHGLLGSIKDQTYGEFLKTAPFEPFDARSCERCQFNTKNRAMNYLMSSKPKHIEFP